MPNEFEFWVTELPLILPGTFIIKLLYVVTDVNQLHDGDHLLKLI